MSQVYAHIRSVCICMRLFYFLSLLNLWDWCVSVSHDSVKVDLPTIWFCCGLNVVVLLSLLLTKYFQWCLHNVVHVLACIILLRQCRSPRCNTRTHFLPLWFCSLLLIHVSRSLSFLSALVYEITRRLFDGFCWRCIARRVSQSQFWRVMIGRTLGLFDAFPTLVGGHHWSLGTTFPSLGS